MKIDPRIFLQLDRRPAPSNAELGVTNGLQQDQAALARRKAAAPLLAAKPQVACDHGLFSDEAAQIDLIEMLMDPVQE